MLNPISTLNTHFFQQCSPLDPFKPLREVKEKILATPMMQRVTANWQTLLLGASTAVAVAAFAVALFTGAHLSCGVFFLLTVTSAIGAAAAHRSAALNSLQTSVADLKIENDRLKTTARDLENTYRRYEQQVGILTTQVSQLHLQLNQMRESAQRIRDEVNRFQQQNAQMGHNNHQLNQTLQLIDQQHQTSTALAAQIGNILDNHQAGLGNLLHQLETRLTEISADNRVLERIQQLDHLRYQVQQATTDLGSLRTQFAQERAEYNLISQSLWQLRHEFQAVLSSASGQFGHNNNTLQQIADRFQQMLNNRTP
ncbi:MAG: hypothetical protein V4492_07960 [Chlamydiota bacterium]